MRSVFSHFRASVVNKFSDGFEDYAKDDQDIDMSRG